MQSLDGVRKEEISSIEFIQKHIIKMASHFSIKFRSIRASNIKK